MVWRRRQKRHYLTPVPIDEIYERWIVTYERTHLQALRHLQTGLDERPDGLAAVCLRDLHGHHARDALECLDGSRDDEAILGPPHERSRLDSRLDVDTPELL